MKKTASFLLTGLLIFSLLFVGQLSAFAETTSYWDKKPQSQENIIFLNGESSDGVKTSAFTKNGSKDKKAKEINKTEPEQKNYNKIIIPFVTAGMVICLIVVIIIQKIRESKKRHRKSLFAL